MTTAGTGKRRVYPTTPGTLKDGDNTIELRVEGTKPTDGIIYDYLRFEREDVPIRLVDDNGNTSYPNQSSTSTTRTSGLPTGNDTGANPEGPARSIRRCSMCRFSMLRSSMTRSRFSVQSRGYPLLPPPFLPTE